MENYRKVKIYLDEKTYKEIELLLEYRNKRILVYDMDKKSRSIEEFAKGSVLHYLKQIKNQDSLAGIDDLGKPYRLNNRFKEIMEKKHLKAKDLCELTKISPSNISTILANKNQPSLDYFLRIWIALGCPPLNECLYREDGEMEE